jgi:hypothetical protein
LIFRNLCAMKWQTLLPHRNMAMPRTPSPAQSAAARANGARSHGPTTEAGKAASARNGTRHGLRSGPFRLLPAEDAQEFEELHAAVTCDWGPRDAYERRWVMELVTAYWRQDRLRGLEVAALAAATEEGAPSEATLKRLATFARYGARIDKDIAKALQALRSLRNRPDDWLDEPQKRTDEPKPATASAAPPPPAPPPATAEPTPIAAARTSEPEQHLNRHQRRALAAMQRRAA